MSTYISETATVVTYKKEDATVSTLFSNTKQRVHIFADGCPLGLYKWLYPAPIYLGGSTPFLYIREVHTLAIHIYPRTPTDKAIKAKIKKETEKMSFAKYFEDNMEIIEERFALRQQENDHAPIYRITQEVGSKIYLVTTKVVEVKPEASKKHKRKKKKIVCCDCGETFLFTGGEQKYYEERKLSEPKRCPACRQKRKELFKALKKNEEV